MEPSQAGLSRNWLSQATGLLELPRLVWHMPRLTQRPRGDGKPVLVLPGYGAGDGSTLALRFYLQLIGYRARGWSLGRNHGDGYSLLPQVVTQVANFAQETGCCVSLIGWSMGGFLAREAARDRPDLVDRVITLGTPVVGGPKYTAVAENFRRRGFDLEAIEAAVEARNQVPLKVPVTAIYSRTDGVVAWPACIDRLNSNVEHIEVHTTHLGLGFSPDVYQMIKTGLTQHQSFTAHAGRQSSFDGAV